MLESFQMEDTEENIQWPHSLVTLNQTMTNHEKASVLVHSSNTKTAFLLPCSCRCHAIWSEVHELLLMVCLEQDKLQAWVRL